MFDLSLETWVKIAGFLAFGSMVSAIQAGRAIQGLREQVAELRDAIAQLAPDPESLDDGSYIPSRFDRDETES